MKLQLLILSFTIANFIGCSTKPKTPVEPPIAAVETAQKTSERAKQHVKKTQTSVETARLELKNIESKTLQAIEISKLIEALASE